MHILRKALSENKTTWCIMLGNVNEVRSTLKHWSRIIGFDFLDKIQVCYENKLSGKINVKKRNLSDNLSDSIANRLR
jgi:hypothetical protein